jgi:uncharacterized protein (TIGR02996 family)
MAHLPVDVAIELERTMLVLGIEEPGRARELAFTRHTLALGRSVPTLTLGQAPDADVDISGADPSHAKIVEREGRAWLIAKSGCLVDGAAPPREHEEARLDVGSTIGIGDALVHVKAFAPIAPEDFEASEREFLAMIADASDIGARLVYADALEEGEWLVRAEYLRVQVRLTTGQEIEGDRAAHERLVRKLAPARRWLAAVGRPLLALR